MTHDTLEPLAPAEALEMHLQSKKTDGASPTTIRAHRIRLTHFIDWCEQENIENLNTLTGRDCHRFKLWRQDDGDLNKVSVKTQMDTLRVFLRTCASVDGVSPNLPDKVKSPSLGKGENSREVMVSPEAADVIEKHLRKYDYASLWHAYVVLLRTGLRNGAIRSLDIDDYLREEEALQLKHRPQQDTPLKNGDEGERFVSLDDNQCTVLNDWLETIGDLLCMMTTAENPFSLPPTDASTGKLSGESRTKSPDRAFTAMIARTTGRYPTVKRQTTAPQNARVARVRIRGAA